MVERVPLVKAIENIRLWPMGDEQQAWHIDSLFEAVLKERYECDGWLFGRDVGEPRIIRASRWEHLESDNGDELMRHVFGSDRRLDCKELEAAGAAWLRSADTALKG